MGMLKVIVTDHVFQDFDQEREILGGVGAELEVQTCTTVDELIPHLAGVHGILNTYLPGIDARVFDAAPDVKAVVRYGIGIDTIDIREATVRGIVVANVPDYCVDEVADHALAHFLCLARKIGFSDRKVKRGEWSLGYVKPLPAIRSMRVGVIGFGRIGRAIARRLKAFGCEVVFSDPLQENKVEGCRRVALDELLSTCNAVFVQCPATPETHHLIDRSAFERMRKGSIFINCARGEIVDTEALIWALENGRIGGAGLDVLEDEAAVVGVNHPLKRMENVQLTPHSAWYSTAAMGELRRKSAEEVLRVLSGKKPKYRVA